VTAWSLPILMGVDMEEVDGEIVGPLAEIDAPRWRGSEVQDAAGGLLIPHAADTAPLAANRLLAAGHEVYWLAEPPAGRPGDLWLPPGTLAQSELQDLLDTLHLPATPLAQPPSGAAHRLTAPRVGLYKPWVASMDEGWTRFVLEQYEFDYSNLSNADFSAETLGAQVDVVLLPDVERSILENGEPEDAEAKRFWSERPPEYRGGIGTEGGEALRAWVEGGGTLVALDSSTEYVIQLFSLPVTNVLAGVGGDFAAPGTMLRMLVDVEHPLGYGMRADDAGYFASSPAFRTGLPHGKIDRRVVARYPDHRDDIPVSGYIAGAERLERRAAVVELTYGDGRIVLIGFRAQHRAQPHRSFKLLFNALYWGLLEAVVL
jgi:hypothetical protein